MPSEEEEIYESCAEQYWKIVAKITATMRESRADCNRRILIKEPEDFR
jgi:hypothetical protein